MVSQTFGDGLQAIRVCVLILQISERYNFAQFFVKSVNNSADMFFKTIGNSTKERLRARLLIFLNRSYFLEHRFAQNIARIVCQLTPMLFFDVIRWKVVRTTLGWVRAECATVHASCVRS